MTALALAGSLLFAPADLTPIHLDLRQLEGNAGEFDGRWVEFDAYVWERTSLNGKRMLMTVPGESWTRADGTPFIACRGTDATNLPVMLRRGIGPLHRRDIVHTARRLPKVRMRAIYHHQPFEFYSQMMFEFPGWFEKAQVVRQITDDWCIDDPPAGAVGPTPVTS